jgi:uncharacterized protein with GYD domain
MATYVILSRVSPEAFKEPRDFKALAKKVTSRIKKDSPGVVWKDSYATMGRFNVVDIIESNDPNQVDMAAMIIHALGHPTTETLRAVPWRDFLSELQVLWLQLIL